MVAERFVIQFAGEPSLTEELEPKKGGVVHVHRVVIRRYEFTSTAESSFSELRTNRHNCVYRPLRYLVKKRFDAGILRVLVFLHMAHH